MKLNWNEFADRCKELSYKIKWDNFDFILPVPKNGLYVAHYLKQFAPTKVEICYPGFINDSARLERILIVDDLVDSGKTLAQFPKECERAVLFAHPDNRNLVNYSTNYNWKRGEWITFPFEKEYDIEENIVRILQYIGEDPNREGLIETPKRMIKSWDKLFGGYKQNPEDVLKTEFSEFGQYDEMIVLKDIEFYSTCEHHFLPFYGKCHIAYIPDKKVVGISKLARLVEVFARRLQIQERLTSEIAENIENYLNPKGVAVLVEAQHFCMTSRGVEKQNSKMVTSKILGAFRQTETRHEFLNLIK